MKLNLFYVSIGLIVMAGSSILIKVLFFPARTKNNLLLRSLISGIGGALLTISLMVLNFYNTSPSALYFWSEWTLPKIIGFSILVIFPLYCALTIASLIYYTTLEKFKGGCKKPHEEKLKTFVRPASWRESTPINLCQSMSIYVNIFIKSLGSPAQNNYINISGSISGSGNYMPDYGPWIRDN